MKKINNTYLDRSNISYEYNFDGSGNDSAGTVNVSLVNPTWVSADGEYSKEMLDLNGSNAYGTASHSYSGNFTICAAIKFDAFNSNDEAQVYRITGTGSTNIGFSHNNISSLNQFQLFTNDGTSGSSISLTTLVPVVGKWYYVCVSGDGTNRTLKVKDLEANINYSTSTTVAPSVTMSGTANIFRHPSAGRYMNGQCNGITIYNNYAISDDEFEVLALKWRRKFGPTNLGTSIPKTNLVANYEGDISSDGTTWYDVAGSNNGTATNVETITVGKTNVGKFNGTSSQVLITDAINLDADFSISFMINTNVKAGDDYIWNGFGTSSVAINLDTSFNINFNIYDGTVRQVFIPAADYNVGENLFITVTRSKTAGMEIFLNSVSKDTDSFTGNGLALSLGSAIGRHTTNPSFFFDGEIGLFRQFNKVLTQDEINTLYREFQNRLFFPRYSLGNLERNKVLDISCPAVSGTYYDQSGNGNNGTATAVTDSTLGENNVMSFDGVSDYINIASQISISDEFTISMRVKFDSLTSVSRGLISKRDGGSTNNWQIQTNISGNLRLFAWRSGGTYTNDYALSNFTVGVWYDIKYTYSVADGFIKLYVNGVNVGTNTAITLAVLNNNIRTRIGDDNFGNNFDGDISSVEIHDRALSATEIQQDYYSNKIV